MDSYQNLIHDFKNTNPTIAVFMSVCPPPYIGGAEQSAMDYATYLNQNHFNIIIYSLIGKKEAIVKEKIKENLISIKIPISLQFHPLLEIKNRKLLSKIIWHIRNLIQQKNKQNFLLAFKKIKPAAILCHNLPGWGVLPWSFSKKLNIPLVQMCHDYALACFRSTMWTPIRGECKGKCIGCLPRRNVTKYWRKHINIIFVSNYVMRKIDSAIKFPEKAKLKVIIPPINSPQFNEKKSDVKFDFGYIGRITPEKGIIQALESSRRLNKKILVAGEGQFDYVEKLRAEFPEAYFVGTMNKWDFYSQVHVVLVLSLWPEPLARTAIEATILGKPLVLSRNGGLMEVSSMSNNKAYFVNPLDKIEIDRSMIQALNNYDEQNIDASNKDLSFCGEELIKFINSAIDRQ